MCLTMQSYISSGSLSLRQICQFILGGSLIPLTFKAPTIIVVISSFFGEQFLNSPCLNLSYIYRTFSFIFQTLSRNSLSMSLLHARWYTTGPLQSLSTLSQALDRGVCCRRFFASSPWTGSWQGQQRDTRGVQWLLFKQLEDIDFADDVALLSHRHSNLEEKITNVKWSRKTGTSPQ